MSSSDGTGAAPRAVAAAADDEAGPADPWFAPGPKTAGAEADQAWFLPAGRAALQPGSMTESWADDTSATPADPAGRAEAAGAPPWGRESASGTAGEPPPWETGPWPGPGEASDGRPGRTAPDPGAAGPAAGSPGPRRERSLRSRLMIAGGGVVLVLVVAIVVIVTTVSGGPTTGCATYPAPVRQAYARAMSDLSGHAPASVQAADLERAASVANAAAAAAGQIAARTALFAMANDLDTAYSDVTRHRVVSADLQQQLTADGTALPQSCP